MKLKELMEGQAMVLNIQFDVPSDLAQRLRDGAADLNAEVKEAYALALYRQGRLTHVELARLLGLDRFETDALLKSRGVFEGSITADDLAIQDEVVARLSKRIHR